MAFKMKNTAMAKAAKIAGDPRAAMKLKSAFKNEPNLPEGLTRITAEEAYRDNPKLANMGRSAVEDGDNYYKNQYGHVVAIGKLQDASQGGLVVSELTKSEKEKFYGNTDQKFWGEKYESKPKSKPDPKPEVDLSNATITRTGSGKLAAFSKDNPHAKRKMSSAELTKARKWERENKTEFARGKGNRFGGGGGSTADIQQRLSDTYYKRGERIGGESTDPKN